MMNGYKEPSEVIYSCQKLIITCGINGKANVNVQIPVGVKVINISSQLLNKLFLYIVKFGR